MINTAFATNIIVKNISVEHESWHGTYYERLILAVLAKHRPLFIKIVEALISQLNSEKERFMVNFHFSHNINPTHENDYSELELSYPEKYKNIVYQCYMLATRMIKPD